MRRRREQPRGGEDTEDMDVAEQDAPPSHAALVCLRPGAVEVGDIDPHPIEL